jgi:hypothetical protein
MVDSQTVTNVLGTLVLISTSAGAYYANELRSALEGSELANVWKYMGLGVILLFIGALLGGGAKLLFGANPEDVASPLNILLILVLLGSLCFVYGLKLQLDKVK